VIDLLLTYGAGPGGGGAAGRTAPLQGLLQGPAGDLQRGQAPAATAAAGPTAAPSAARPRCALVLASLPLLYWSLIAFSATNTVSHGLASTRWLL
jgi:hypothetical protein